MAVIGRVKLDGSGSPSSLFKSGLGSNKSMWLGPPSRKHQMTLLAVGWKCGILSRDRVFGPAMSFRRLDVALKQRHERQTAKTAAGAEQEIAT